MPPVEPNPRVPLSVRYEHEGVVVVLKAAGVPTQPGKGHERDTLLNALWARYGEHLRALGAGRDYGLLHRLDRWASGLVIVALRKDAYDTLREDFARRRVRKYYWALTSRSPARRMGVIRRPLLEEAGRRKTARISPRGKASVTAYRVVASTTRGALVECRAVTGRLHQLRVHLASIGCPILGDDLYAPPGVARAAPRLALHAHRVVFRHPVSGTVIDVRAPWPRDLRGVLRRLGLGVPSGHEGHEVGGEGVGDEDAGIGEAPAPP